LAPTKVIRVSLNGAPASPAQRQRQSWARVASFPNATANAGDAQRLSLSLFVIILLRAEPPGPCPSNWAGNESCRPQRGTIRTPRREPAHMLDRLDLQERTRHTTSVMSSCWEAPAAKASAAARIRVIASKAGSPWQVLANSINLSSPHSS